MQHYIYGNLHHAGFQTVSSDTTGFFTNHSDVLSPLMYYDTASAHGELKPGEHNCFWMLTTDLKIPGGQDYLFIQESGMDPYRAAAVVQGYRSDFEDHEADVYGPEFLSLLGTRFVSSQEAMRLGEENQLSSVPLKALPREDVAAETIQPEALAQILTALFQRKRVIIRIPVLGAEAMKRSRGYLKTIYQCLPYEKRRNNGCITGATANMLDISKSFRIVLMDADADISDIATNNYQMVFDLTNKAAASQKETLPLAQFLTNATQQQRDDFFCYCRETILDEDIKGDPDLDTYTILMEESLLAGTILSGEDIRKWAVSLYDLDRRETRKDKVLKELVRALPSQNMAEYLRGMTKEYETAHQFGVLKRADRNHDKDAERDQNGALTLLMMDSLKEWGFGCDSVRDAMADHFVSLAVAEYPCLVLERPYKDTLAEYDAIKLPGTAGGRTAWTNELMELVKGRLEAMISSQKKLYENNLQSQQAAGKAAIQAFDGWKLENLYETLQQHYLHSELIDGWNGMIGHRIVELCCNWSDPRKLDGYSQMHTRRDHMRKVYAANGGTLTKEQDKALRSLEKNWKAIQTLAAQECTCARELDRWMLDADAASWNPELCEELKCEKADTLLSAIPEGLSLEETKDRLRCAMTYGALLKDPKIAFLPWGAVKAAPADILKRIEMLESYPNTGMPKLNNKKLRSWIVQMLPENKHLMMLLIQKYPEKQAEWVPVLAKKSKGITQEDIRQLYLTGVARSVLCGQRNGSFEWRSAMEVFLPELPKLPQPLTKQKLHQQPANQVLLIVVQILLGLAALIPGVVLLLTGSGSVGIYGIVTGVTAACAAGFAAVAFIPKAKPGKKFLLGLALAMVPGILAGAAGLILNFL